MKPCRSKEKVKCSQCSKMFADDYYLKDHIATKHANETEWKYKCNICGDNKRFQYCATLKKHQHL